MLQTILKYPQLYEFTQALLGSSRFKEEFLQVSKPQANERILDLGCGPASIVGHLPVSVEYLGLDCNNAYIDAAKKRFGQSSKRNFLAANLNDVSTTELGKFDLIFAIGLLHHLDDEETVSLLQKCRLLLKGRGRLVSADPCHTSGQGLISRKLMSMDRGKFIRSREKYEGLYRRVFSHLQSRLSTETLNIPYTHIFIEAEKEEPEGK